MKRLFLATLAVVWATLTATAQTDLTGLVYSNPNILATLIKDVAKEIDSKMDSIRTAAITEKEQKKGRKLTAEELAEVENDVAKAREMMEAMKKGMKMSVGVEFKSPTEVVMTNKTSLDDNALKAAGVSWVKRKAMKAALALAPTTAKDIYVVKGNHVIVGKKNDTDTLRISNDGKYLYGKMDKTKFTLTRTK